MQIKKLQILPLLNHSALRNVLSKGSFERHHNFSMFRLFRLHFFLLFAGITKAVVTVILTFALQVASIWYNWSRVQKSEVKGNGTGKLAAETRKFVS